MVGDGDDTSTILRLLPKQPITNDRKKRSRLENVQFTMKSELIVTGKRSIYVGSIKQAFIDAINRGYDSTLMQCIPNSSAFDKVECISQITLYYDNKIISNDIDFLYLSNQRKLQPVSNSNLNNNDHDNDDENQMDIIIIQRERDLKYQQMVTQILKSIDVHNESDDIKLNDHDINCINHDETDFKYNNCNKIGMYTEAIMTQNFAKYSESMKRLFGQNNVLFNNQLKQINYCYQIQNNLKEYFYDSVLTSKKKFENKSHLLQENNNKLTRNNNNLGKKILQLEKDCHDLKNNLKKQKELNEKLLTQIECKPNVLNTMNCKQLFKLHELYLQNARRVKNAIESNSTNEKLCIICCHKQKNVVFQPCGHFHTCKQCSNQIDKCPICQVQITQKINVFQ